MRGSVYIAQEWAKFLRKDNLSSEYAIYKKFVLVLELLYKPL